MSTLLNELKDSIISVDEESRSIAQHRIDRLFKPIGSLGQLEENAEKKRKIYKMECEKYI